MRLSAAAPMVIMRRLRRSAAPESGRLRFGDLRRVTPISRHFGFDRGEPIDRYYIGGFLARYAQDIRGHVLEIGDDAYTRTYGGDRVVTSDVLHVHDGNPKATIVADLSRADHLPGEQFDCIIFTQTLQLIFDCRAAVRALHHMVKPGGVILATVPGISQVDAGEWGGTWCWAFTERSMRQLFAESFPDECIVSSIHGNVLAASAFLYGLAASELRRAELDHRDPQYQVLITVRARRPMEVG